MLPENPTPWVILIAETFPEWQSLPPDCVIPLGISVNPPDFSDAIEAVSRGHGREALRARLRREHPVDRPHHPQFDARIWNVLVEAEAFAWAQDVARFGAPEFVEREGAPDLRVGSRWIEAKTIERSREERSELQRLSKSSRAGVFMPVLRVIGDPAAGFIGKFDAQLDDALRKLARQGGGRLVTFFDLAGIDFGTDREVAHAVVAEWARLRAATTRSAIVVCYNHHWWEPFVIEGL